MRLRRRITLAGVVAALVLSGCTGPRAEADPSPPDETVTGTVSPQPTPSVTPSPTPTVEAVAPPEPPADLARTDEVGAAAAATYFLQLYGYVMRTGDVEVWDAMSSDTCGFCARAREFAVNNKSARNFFSGADFTVVSAVVHPIDTLLQAYPVDVSFTQTAAEQRTAAGEVLLSSPADSGLLGVDVTHDDAGWKVLAVTAQDA